MTKSKGRSVVKRPRVLRKGSPATKRWMRYIRSLRGGQALPIDALRRRFPHLVDEARLYQTYGGGLGSWLKEHTILKYFLPKSKDKKKKKQPIRTTVRKYTTPKYQDDDDDDDDENEYESDGGDDYDEDDVADPYVYEA